MMVQTDANQFYGLCRHQALFRVDANLDFITNHGKQKMAEVDFPDGGIIITPKSKTKAL